MNVYNYLMLRYVPQLLGKTQAEKAKVQESLSFIADMKVTITKPCYDPDSSKAVEKVGEIASKIQLIEKKLEENDWLIGSSPTVVDLFLMEVTDQIEMITKGAWLKNHPTLEAHNSRTK